MAEPTIPTRPTANLETQSEPMSVEVNVAARTVPSRPAEGYVISQKKAPSPENPALALVNRAMNMFGLNSTALANPNSPSLVRIPRLILAGSCGGSSDDFSPQAPPALNVDIATYDPIELGESISAQSSSTALRNGAVAFTGIREGFEGQNVEIYVTHGEDNSLILVGSIEGNSALNDAQIIPMADGSFAVAVQVFDTGRVDVFFVTHEDGEYTLGQGDSINFIESFVAEGAGSLKMRAAALDGGATLLVATETPDGDIDFALGSPGEEGLTLAEVEDVQDLVDFSIEATGRENWALTTMSGADGENASFTQTYFSEAEVNSASGPHAAAVALTEASQISAVTTDSGSIVLAGPSNALETSYQILSCGVEVECQDQSALTPEEGWSIDDAQISHYSPLASNSIGVIAYVESREVEASPDGSPISGIQQRLKIVITGEAGNLSNQVTEVISAIPGSITQLSSSIEDGVLAISALVIQDGQPARWVVRKIDLSLQ